MKIVAKLVLIIASISFFIAGLIVFQFTFEKKIKCAF